MPHCILEYSDNVIDEPDLGKLFLEIHVALARTGLFRRGDIKSRAVCCREFAVGDGAPDRAFVAMEVCIFEGRDDGVKAGITAAVLEVLGRHFRRTIADPRCSVTVRLTDMHRGSYAKGGG